MKQEHLEDYFLNLAWICVNRIHRTELIETLKLKVERSMSWGDGYQYLVNANVEKVLLYFEVDQWQFIVGKYFFLEDDTLKKLLNNLSQGSRTVNAFAIDVWSSYYFYSKSVNGRVLRFWKNNDGKIVDEGDMLVQEKELKERETANRILELAENTVMSFEHLELVLQSGEVQILREV